MARGAVPLLVEADRMAHGAVPLLVRADPVAKLARSRLPLPASAASELVHYSSELIREASKQESRKPGMMNLESTKAEKRSAPWIGPGVVGRAKECPSGI
jgi:hypothetical protein